MERRELLTKTWGGVAPLDSGQQCQIFTWARHEVLPWEPGGEVGLGEGEDRGQYPTPCLPGLAPQEGCSVVFVSISGNRK